MNILSAFKRVKWVKPTFENTSKMKIYEMQNTNFRVIYMQHENVVDRAHTRTLIHRSFTYIIYVKCHPKLSIDMSIQNV